MSAYGAPVRLPIAYEFGPYRLDCVQRVLLLNGDLMALTPKSLDVLFALVERRGQIVDREELMRTVWPDTFVEESSLTFQISTLRKTLGDGLIETIPKRGYRFIASISDVRAPSPIPVIAP